MEIRITRAEGPTKQCGKERVTNSFAGADLILRAWSNTAPEGGGYDKCDFHLSLIAYGRDINYDGRYDLKHWRDERPDLRAHILGHLDYYAGRACPSHITQEQYEAGIRHIEQKDREEAMHWHDIIKMQP